VSAGRRHRRAVTSYRQAQLLAEAQGQPPRLVGRVVGMGEAWMRGKVMFVVPSAPPDDAPPTVKEGITRRRVLAVTGACPCGAGYGRPNGVGAVPITHEHDCPASDALLLAAIDEWKQAAS
jgi:hypothetical protein